MSNSYCPLKLAATQAPKNYAIAEKITYQELDSLAEKMMLDLHKKGIETGDLITTFYPTSVELIALFFAAWRLKASICPISLRTPPKQVTQMPELLKPKLFVDRFPLSPPLAGEKKPPQSLLLFTSGSTGTQKVATLSLKSLIANAKYSVPLQEEDRWLLSLPLYHVSGIGIMLRCVLAKAAIVLDSSHANITHISCVPTQLYRMSPCYKNLKCLLVGGAPLGFLPKNLPIYATYGLSEMGSMVLLKKNPQFVDGKLYLGDPLPKREIKLAPDGEILVRGDTLFDGYVDQPHDPNEWFATGDRGLRHPEHGIAIVGRKDWQFISGGENIQPEEIEQKLLQIPEILEAAVIPKKDPEFGHRPIAFIQTNGSLLSTKIIQERLQDLLPKYKIPIEVYSLNKMPKIGLKIDRKTLQKKTIFN